MRELYHLFGYPFFFFARPRRDRHAQNVICISNHLTKNAAHISRTIDQSTTYGAPFPVNLPLILHHRHRHHHPRICSSRVFVASQVMFYAIHVTTMDRICWTLPVDMTETFRSSSSSIAVTFANKTKRSQREGRRAGGRNLRSHGCHRFGDDAGFVGLWWVIN